MHRPSGAPALSGPSSRKADGVAITVTPPASASEHSPCRSAWLARCTATSDELHAVSTLIAGPSSPKKYATRPEATLGRRARTQIPRQIRRAAAPAPQPGTIIITENAHENTGRRTLQRLRADTRPLQRLPAQLQNQPLLRIDRHRLTRADPEKPRIKLTRIMQHPALRHHTPAGHPRSRGSSDTASRPSASNSHNASGDTAPPGKRQLTDTTAIGSSAGASTPDTAAGRSAPSPSNAPRYPPSAPGVG